MFLRIGVISCSPRAKEVFEERLGEIAAVADQLPPQFFSHLWDRFAVIGVGGRELNSPAIHPGH